MAGFGARTRSYTGGRGNDSLVGSSNAETLYGLDGNDTLNGGGGADTLVGGTGNDVYVVNNPGVVLVELPGEGIDTVQASISYTLPDNIENLILTGSATLSGTGNGFANTLKGNSGANLLDGGAGNDILDGGAGNDTLIGGSGVDILTGGAGADVFRFRAVADSGVGNGARDTITDFDVTADTIDLTALIPNQHFTFMGAAAFAAGGTPQIRYDIINNTTVVQIDAPVGSGQAPGVVNSEIALTGAKALTIANFTGAIAPALPATPAAPAAPISAPGVIHVGVNDDLAALVRSAGPGATFDLAAGVHRLQSVTPLDHDTFIGDPGAILSGASLLTGFAHVGNTWVVGGQSQNGLVREAGEGLDGFAMPGDPNQVFFDNQPLTQVASLAAVKAGTYYFNHVSKQIYLGSDPTGHTVEAAVSPYAFAGGATGVTIANLTVEKYANPVQFGAIGSVVNPVGWTIDHVEARLNFGVGISVGSNSQILNSFVHDNGEMGLGGSGTNILVQGNEIAHNGYFSGIDPLWEGGGSKFAVTDGLVVRGNNSHDNNGYGLWTDIDNIHTLYENNTLTNNLYGGISHEISYDAIIRNNNFTGNGTVHNTWLWGAAVQIQNSSNVEVYGNTINMTNAGNGIALIQQDRGTGLYGPHTTINNHVHDNTMITGLPDAGGFGLLADYNVPGALAGHNTFDYNTYKVTSAVDDHWAWGDWYSFAAYKAISGQDLHSTVALI